MEIVALDDEIAIQGWLADGLVRVRQQRAIRHREMVVIDEFFAFKVQFRHGLQGFQYGNRLRTGCF